MARTDDDNTRTGEGSRALGDRRDRDDGEGRAGGTALTEDHMRTARGRQREEFGGSNFGAAFFGWLVAIGMAVILTAILSAAGAAIGLTNLSGQEATKSAGTISIVGGAILIAILALAYYAGGYVAGRMSRFDGGRQGILVWLIGLVVTLLVAAAAAIGGSEYNIFSKLSLPRIPIKEGDLSTGGIIALVAILVLTLLAAFLGGKVGERYHKKIDRVAVTD